VHRANWGGKEGSGVPSGTLEGTGDWGGVRFQVGEGRPSVQWRTGLDRDGGSPSSNFGLMERGDLGGDCTGLGVDGMDGDNESGYTSSKEDEVVDIFTDNVKGFKQKMQCYVLSRKHRCIT
jgi:hypothetical protein